MWAGRQTLAVITVVIWTGSALAGCTEAGESLRATAPPKSLCGNPSATTPAATTRHYLLVANVEGYQAMYTPAQVKAHHPRMGEVMVGGHMTAGSGGAMKGGPMAHNGAMGPASQRHLEVKICNRQTGRNVHGHPTISLVDLAHPHAMAQEVPAAAMEGVTKGARDLHYGNNVALIAGHRYAIRVHVGPDQAVIRLLLRKGRSPVRVP